jgi:cellulose synthase (UDP-forming)
MELETTIWCAALVGFFVGVSPYLPKHKNWARTLVAVIALVPTVRYLWWRLVETLLPAPFLSLEGVWFASIYAFELVGFFNQFLFQAVLSRVSDRSSEADRYEAQLRAMPAELLPGVDVFICTYNEGLDVVERTIVAALAIDYPKFKVWVLDDGNRDWLRDFCEAKGAGYIRRKEHKHAKAGNINHALGVTDAEFFAVLDADFAPFHNFLYRTLGFFRDPKIAIVQTPQHFFNPDPIQLNLGLSHIWPDDQRLFFDVILPSRDAWDCAWCCGSCSVQRREAIASIGGVPTDSITEDLLSTIVLLQKGYITRYLNERLSMGLAPENLEGYFRQRERWCRGNLQTMFLKSGPLGPGKLSLWKRILFLPLDWVIHPAIRLLAIFVPIIYLWTGVGPFLMPSVSALLAYQLPVLIAVFGAIRWFAPHSYLPILSTATTLFNSFRIVPTALATFIKPFGTPFRVTPKGSSITFSFGDMTVLGMSLTLMLLTILAIVKHRFFAVGPTDLFLVIAEVWALLNVIVLAVVALIAIESPRPRKEERFPSHEAASYRIAQQEFHCRIRDISVSGALLDIIESGEGSLSLSPVHVPIPYPSDNGHYPQSDSGHSSLELIVEDSLALPATIVRSVGARVAVQFAELTTEDRDRLIRHIYSLGRNNAVHSVRAWNIVRGMFKSFARD